MRRQRTLKGVLGCEGITLHTGEYVQVKIRPNQEGTGIRFIRSDFDDAFAVRADVRNVSDTFYSTTLSYGGMSVATVEHLMAAMAAIGITHADILVNGSELPILDGSSRDWVSLIDQVGITEGSEATVPELVIKRPVAVKDLDRSATLLPSDEFSVDCSIEFDHPLIQHQTWEGVINADTFRAELASARTFGMLRDVEYLRARGRARGANLTNAIVLDDRTVVSPDGLRFENEFVRHKVLDAIGDLSLLGMPIRGHLVSRRSGHKVHQQLLKVLLESPECWELSIPHKEQEVGVLERFDRLARVIC